MADERKIALMIADGSEEIEALTVADVMRRAGVPVDIISVMGRPDVTCSRGVRVIADRELEETDLRAYDMIVLPGGLKGTENFGKCAPLTDALKAFAPEGRMIAAICAAPTLLARLGLLRGRRATCNPGFMESLEAEGAKVDREARVVRDGNIITSQAMGTAMDFALFIAASYRGQEEADRISGNIVYR